MGPSPMAGRYVTAVLLRVVGVDAIFQRVAVGIVRITGFVVRGADRIAVHVNFARFVLLGALAVMPHSDTSHAGLVLIHAFLTVVRTRGEVQAKLLTKLREIGLLLAHL